MCAVFFFTMLLHNEIYHMMEPFVYLIRGILLMQQCKNRLEKEEISQPMSLHGGEHSRSYSKSEYLGGGRSKIKFFAFPKR